MFYSMVVRICVVFVVTYQPSPAFAEDPPGLRGLN